LVAGRLMTGGAVQSVEGKTWAGTKFENRSEGVYVLNNTKVVKCTFMRFV
jgi:hypothetical protein